MFFLSGRDAGKCIPPVFFFMGFRRKIELCFLAAALLAACNQGTEVVEEKPAFSGEYELLIAASQGPDDPETRTEVVDWKKVYWLPAEKISVFSAGQMAEFVSHNTERAASTTFQGRITIDSQALDNGEWIWALYPYDAQATISDGVITTTLPAAQEAVAEGVADDLLATCARAKNPVEFSGDLEFLSAATGVESSLLWMDDDGVLTADETPGTPGSNAGGGSPTPDLAIQMHFDHLCSGLRFCLTQKGVERITLTANGGEALAGCFSFRWDDEGVPEIVSVSQPSSSITLTGPDGGKFKKGVWYAFVTLPVQLSQGLTFTLEAGSKVGTRVISSPINLRRGAFSRATDMDKDVELVEPIPDLPSVNYGLPVLYIYTENGAAIVNKTDWVNASSYLKDTDGTVTALGLTKIRGRGNSTWGYRKKPYAIKFDSKTALLGMPKDKRWDLLANYLDRTRLRNDVALEMGRRLTGLAWTPKGRYVDLVLNDVHQGNYYLVEHIKIAKDRVNITEMESGDVTEPAITGGYLMELSIEYDEVNKFQTNNFHDLYSGTWGIMHQGTGTTRLPFMIKEPEEDVMVPDQLTWITNWINGVQGWIVSNNGSAWRQVVDMDSFIDWMFVQEIVGNGETLHPKSCYMHKDREGKLVMGPLWDFDYNTFNNGIGLGHTYNYSLWYGYMFRDPTFKALAKARWPAAKVAFAEARTYANVQAAAIRNSVTRDCQIWGNAGNTVNGDESLSYEDAVARLRSVMSDRVSRLDAIINSW